MRAGRTHTHAKAVDVRMHPTFLYSLSSVLCTTVSHQPCVTACLQTRISPLAFYLRPGQILTIKRLEEVSDLFNTCCPSKTLSPHLTPLSSRILPPTLFPPSLSFSAQALYYFADLLIATCLTSLQSFYFHALCCNIHAEGPAFVTAAALSSNGMII